MDDRDLKGSLNRRNFLKEASSFTLLSMLAAEEIRAQEAQPAPAEAEAAPAGPPVVLGVIGLGPQGRDSVGHLAKMPGVTVAAVCDTYDAFLKRGQQAAPKAAAVKDYKALLDQKDVQGVVVATPTHQHKQIVLDALQAGKHVYCEAPIAHTLEDAKAIAQAGKTSKQVFQVGQQLRSNPMNHHVGKFTSFLAKKVGAKSQWHRKTSWRRAAPTSEREREINWRLSKETSPGLIGEEGVHQIDVVNWYFKELPTSVTGFGGILGWTDDGRDVPDTIQAVFEYPSGLRLMYDATLVNSFDGVYEAFLGSDAAILIRGNRAWIIKEADSPLLGWEVYARKEKIEDDLGIALIANATKQLAAGKEPSQTGVDPTPPLYYALEEFANCIREQKAPACGALEGYQAAVSVLKANEAILSGSKVTFQKEWFDLA